MYIVFFSTSNVFKAEEILVTAGVECKVVPTPVTDKAYCGVCIQTDNLKAEEMCEDMEYEIVKQEVKNVVA